STGAVIPNASVSLSHTVTDIKFQTTTNTAGFYVFPSLQTGEYTLAITVPGMQRWQGKAVLAAGQRGVIDATLEVAKSTDQITVAGDVTPLLSTTSPTV